MFETLLEYQLWTSLWQLQHNLTACQFITPACFTTSVGIIWCLSIAPSWLWYPHTSQVSSIIASYPRPAFLIHTCFYFYDFKQLFYSSIIVVQRCIVVNKVKYLQQYGSLFQFILSFILFLLVSEEKEES